MSSDVYWAAQANTVDVVRAFEARRAKYRRYLDNSGATRRTLRAVRAYYGYGPGGTGDTSRLGSSGDRGQYVEMAHNEFAGLVEQAVAQLLASKPAFQAVPRSGDYTARSQAAFADKLLTAIDTDNHLEEREDEAVRAGMLCREAWVVSSWDKSAGDAFAIDGEKTVTAGDLRVDVALPWDVVLETRLRHKADAQWFGWCRPVNRYDLAAAVRPTEAEMGDPSAVDRKAQLRAAILGAPVTRRGDWAGSEIRDFLWGDELGDSEDLVDVWELRHKPTPALPQGRLVRFLSSSCILYDSAEAGEGYPYQGLLAQWFEPGKTIGTAGGHTLVWDLLGLQEAIDMVATSMATAASASGVSNIWAPSVSNGQASNLTVSTLANGMNLIQSPVKPEALHAVQVDPQAVAFLEACRAWAQRRMGLNDVSMGDPTKGMPAQLAALLDAKVLQFWNTAVKSLSTMRARVRTDALSLFQSFAKAPRTTALVGKGEQHEMAEWTRERLQMVARVTVEPVSAVSKTLAGKMQTADLLLERGLINTVDEYLTVKATGRLEKLTEFQDRNLLRLQREKELLQEGIGLPPVDVAATQAAQAVDPQALPVFSNAPGEYLRPTLVDTPWLDIPEYAAVLASIEARNRPDVVQAVTDAITYKMQMWRVMPPELIFALGGTPPPPAGMPGEAPIEVPESEMPGLESEMRPIEPPKPPPNPITGEQSAAPSDVTQPV